MIGYGSIDLFCRVIVRVLNMSADGPEFNSFSIQSKDCTISSWYIFFKVSNFFIESLDHELLINIRMNFGSCDSPRRRMIGYG
jgi:hypothetical protein